MTDKTKTLLAIEGFASSYGKKLLARHAASFEARCGRTPLNSSRVQASLLRRTLLYAIASSKESVFGLPKAFPKTVVLLNLSGDHALLYSASTELLGVVVKCLVDPYKVQVYLDALKTLVAWGESQSDLKVSFLLTGVLPWQEGLGSCHFEIRTVVNDDGKLCDGQKLIASGLIGVRDGSPTTEPVGSSVGPREVKALSNDVSAVSVDKNDTDEEETAPTSIATATDREKALRAIADRLRDQRQELESQLLERKASEEARVAEIASKIEARTQEQISQTQKVKDLCKTKMEVAEDRISKAMQTALTAEKELTDAKRAAANQFLTLRASVEAAEKQKKVVSAASQSTMRQNTELGKKVEELTKELRETREKHKQSVSTEIERCIAARDEAVLRARSAEDTIQKLGEVLDRRDNEAAALNAQLEEYRKEVAKCQNEVTRCKHEVAKSKEPPKKREEKKTTEELDRLRREMEKLQKKGKTHFSTNTTGTDTFVDTMVQSKATQTGPAKGPPEPVSKAEVCRAASVALERLIKLTQTQHTIYDSAFHGHIDAPVFRPAAVTAPTPPPRPNAPPPPPSPSSSWS